MLTRRVIPCLDTRGGRVVKGVRFERLRDVGSPTELAARYEEDGADELVILDVSATVDGRNHAVDTIRAVRDVIGIPLTAGGGIASVDDAAALLDVGADKIAVNTAAVRRPELLTELASRFGQQCVTLSIDCAAVGGGGGAGWEVVVRAGTAPAALDAITWAVDGARLGAGEVLLTSIDRDGTQCGYDVDLIAGVSRRVRVPVVASGGARSPDDMLDALRAGADAVLAASIFHDGVTTVRETKQRLGEAGIEVRP
ncbi:MAG TPA: imidazole glycerol phosphate synthase subunit HisF, partial [Gemmatimonadaceae bacterium]|nr:imidazole glycerol phosphate synthase subunit HisF [Gemmatimonadaceae bacterium]